MHEYSEQCNLAELVALETDAPPPEVNEVRVTRPARDLFGVSLSGGGIRSATFNLGVLQALQRLRLLDRLDYLSTVSGGGYVGSFWTAWRTRREAPADGGSSPLSGGRAPDRPPSAFPEGEGTGGRPEPDAIRHLRYFGNFLTPHLGILKWDTGRMLVSLLSSMVPSLLAALSVIALVLLAWSMAAWGVLGLGSTGSIATLVAVTALVLIGAEVVWTRRGEEHNAWTHAEAALWAFASVAFLWFVLHRALWGEGGRPYAQGQRLPGAAPGEPLAELLVLVSPVAAWAGVSLAFSVRRWLASRSVTTHDARVARASFDRVHARLLLAAGVWTAAALVWWAGAALWGAVENVLATGAGLGGATALVVLVFSRIQKRFVADPGVGFGTGLTARLKPLLPQLLAYLAIGLMAVGTAVLIVAFEASDTTLNAPLVVGAAAGALLAFTAWRLNPNEIGLHTFYRARIARAYLGASNLDPDPEGAPRTEERAGDDIPLYRVEPRRPCHLICCG